MMSTDTYTRAADVLRARGHHNLAEYCQSRTISAKTGCPIVEAMLFLENNGRAFMAEAYMEKLITVDELLRDAVATAASC